MRKLILAVTSVISIFSLVSNAEERLQRYELVRSTPAQSENCPSEIILSKNTLDSGALLRGLYPANLISPIPNVDKSIRQYKVKLIDAPGHVLTITLKFGNERFTWNESDSLPDYTGLLCQDANYEFKGHEY